MKKILFVISIVMFMFVFFACGPSAEDIETASKISEDVLASNTNYAIEGESKGSFAGSGEFEANGYEGSVTFSYTGGAEWDDVEPESGFTNLFSYEFDAELDYKDFLFEKESEYKLNGKLGNNMSISYQYNATDNIFKIEMSYDITSTNFTATEGETTHTINYDLSLTGDVTMTSDSVDSNASLAGSVTVDGTEVSGTDLSINYEGFFSEDSQN